MTTKAEARPWTDTQGVRCFRHSAFVLLVWLAGACGDDASGSSSDAAEGGDGTRTPPSPGADVNPVGETGEVGPVSIVTIGGLPGAGTVASAWDDFKVPIGSARFRVPRGMYFAACNTDTDNPRFFLSANVESGITDKDWPTQDEVSALWQDRWWHGVVIEAEYEPGVGLQPVKQASQPDCQEMRGIAVAPDCSFVGALCMKPNSNSVHPSFEGNGAFTKDLVESTEGLWRHDRNGGTWPEELWLYEWTDADVQGEPDKYVVHGSAGSSWHYMNYRLVLGDDNTYGILTKQYNGGHEGSSFMVLNRDDYTFDTGRSRFSGGCQGSAGHPLFGFLAHNPATSAYAVHCGGDWDNGDHPGVDVHTRGVGIEGVGGKELYRTLGNQHCCHQGAPGGIVPMDDGGYMLAFTTVADEAQTQPLFEGDAFPTEARTVAALMRVDAQGEVVWGPRYVRYPEGGEKFGGWLSNAMIADLGNGNYLFGYGRSGIEDPDIDYSNEEFEFVGERYVPFEYVLFEIDGRGDPITDELVTTEVGWGPQDEPINLGPGRVAWAYVPHPARPLSSEAKFEGDPPGNSMIDELALFVYESANP